MKQVTVKSVTLINNTSPRKQPKFRCATTGFPAKWRLRNERSNSIFMTRHYPDLVSASDWLKHICHAAQPIRRTTQNWLVTGHQYGISVLVSQTSFRGETSGRAVNVGFFLRWKQHVSTWDAFHWAQNTGYHFGLVRPEYLEPALKVVHFDRSVRPKCLFPIDKIVVPSAALLYPAYKNNNQTRGGLGRVCATAMYRKMYRSIGTWSFRNFIP